MTASKETIILQNGIEMPVLGFGTWQSSEGSEAYEATMAALEAGYRHIDTAFAYGNEKSIGKAVNDSGIKREELFITTKLWNNDHGYENTLRAFDKSLNNLGLDCIDLYLIHWPVPFKFRDCFEQTNAGSWQAMEELYRKGLIKSIGISNFQRKHIDLLLKTAEIVPMVNQIRLYPGYIDEDTVRYSRELNIVLEAYSPLGTGKLLSDGSILQTAEKYGKTPAQICLRWSLQKGFVPLPKSVTPQRIKANAEIFDFELSEDDMQLLSDIENCCGDGADPDNINF